MKHPNQEDLLNQVKALQQQIQVFEDSIRFRDRQLQDLKHRIDSSEKRYRLLFENANDAIFIAQDGYAKFPNPKALEIVGYSETELSEIPYLDFIHPEDRNLLADRKQKKVKGRNVPATYNIRILNHTGKKIWVQLNTTQIIWDGKPATINFMRDITEQKVLEEQLQQACKMEAIGTLAGGIAHDFNNILYPIIGYAEILKQDNPEGSSTYNNSVEILKATKRAKNLVQQILTFCRKTSEEKKQIQVQPILKESLKLLRSSIPTTIAFDIEIDEDCGPILGDPTQIHRIIMNLCTNAYQAMEETGGKLTIRLNQVHVDTPAVSCLDQSRYLQISVADTGCGIERRSLNRLFDPYFTTKEKGTGLGLSVVHGIVKSHDGDIRVKSRKGKGTEFTVTIPVVEACTADPKIIPFNEIPKGNESILFVDDEEQIAELGEATLSRLGYQVTAVTDSNQALELFQADPDRFNLIVTDLTMPGLTGDQLAKQVLKIREVLPIILCTGYGDKVFSTRKNPVEFRAYIRKPTLMSKLARCIREVLDNARNERRRFQRYPVKSTSVWFSEPGEGNPGRVINISKGGVCFNYIAGDPIPNRNSVDALSIITDDNSVRIDRIPCRMIYQKQTGLTAEGDSLRNCAFQFPDVNQIQMKQLQALIENHAESHASLYY